MSGDEGSSVWTQSEILSILLLAFEDTHAGLQERGQLL